jgi:formamidopyrimidine-DNA glycosylase
MGTVSTRERRLLLSAIKETLTDMTAGGGRDTEKDLFGRPGGYATVMSRKTLGGPCPRCGSTIAKAAFAGGTVYFCLTCQPMD